MANKYITTKQVGAYGVAQRSKMAKDLEAVSKTGYKGLGKVKGKVSNRQKVIKLIKKKGVQTNYSK